MNNNWRSGRTKYMKDELFDYLKSFMIQNEWYNTVTQEQARAIFTAICLIGYIDADTAECDNMLLNLYNESIMEDITSYDYFEAYMIKLIV